MPGGEGSQADFGTAALEHLDALYGYAIILTRNEPAAEDLVQETYLRAVRAFGRLVPDSNLKNWLFAILRNIWLNQLRHSRSGPSFVEMDEADEDVWVDPTVDDPHATYVRNLERAEVRSAIESLAQPYREVIVLREFEGFSYQEIASILGCPAGTVMSRLGRAREKLRLILMRLRTGSTGRGMAKESI